MITNLDKHLKWIKEEYDFDQDPVIVLSRENLGKLYGLSL